MIDQEEAMIRIERQLKETGNKKAAYYACKSWEFDLWDVLEHTLLIELFVDAKEIPMDSAPGKDIFVWSCVRKLVPLAKVLVEKGFLSHKNRDVALTTLYGYQDENKILIELILDTVNDYKWAKKRFEKWGVGNKEVIAKWLYKKEKEKKLKKKK